jgi:ACS family hexuronate transporter-like MFS transporter
LKTIQLLLEPRQRTLGNSLLQSGTALGAILASPAIGLLTGGDPMKWRTPFLVIGAGGCVWVLFWLMSIRPRDLRAAAEARAFSDVKITPDSLGPKQTFLQSILSWKFLALAVMVVCINLNWHLFRVWLPKFLQSARDYSFDDMLVFQTFYYVAADVGALTAGAVSGWLVHRGLTVYGGRMVVFAVCSALTTLASIAIFLPSGPLLLGTILLVGFGGLGCFTAFYSMTQDLSHEHQGKISGSLSTITWLTTAPFHKAFGRYLDQTHDYETVFATVGWLPMLSFVVTVLLWNRKRVT